MVLIAKISSQALQNSLPTYSATAVLHLGIPLLVDKIARFLDQACECSKWNISFQQKVEDYCGSFVFDLRWSMRLLKKPTRRGNVSSIIRTAGFIFDIRTGELELVPSLHYTHIDPLFDHYQYQPCPMCS